MQSKAPTIAAYLAELAPPERAVLERLDDLVRSSLGGVTGTMKFGMPTYETAGSTIAINAQKNYFSLYFDPVVLKRYRSQLTGLDCGKSCVRFQALEDLPIETLRQMISDHRHERVKRSEDGPEIPKGRHR